MKRKSGESIYMSYDLLKSVKNTPFNLVVYMDKAQQRTTTYFIIGISLSIAYLFIFDSNWHGSAELHTIMESLATVLSLFVGILALIRFYSLGGTNFLIIGAGFIGISFLDGYHALVTSSWFKVYFPSELASLIPWSWLASRLFLSIIMLSSFLIIKLKLEKTYTNLLSANSVFILTTLATMCSFLFFALVPLPSGYFEGTFFYRPVDLLPALIFLVALIGHYQLGNWKNDDFEHWLVIAIIVSLVAQIIFMPYSSELFDAQFDMAHLLKKASYICVLTGLSINVFKAFKLVKSEADDRKSAQFALEAREMRNRTLMNSLVDGLITISEKGIIENINQAACTLFGYSKLEVLGKNIKMLMPEPYHGLHDGYLSSYKKTGNAKVVGGGRKVVGLRKNGSTFPLDLAVSEMLIGGHKKFSGIIRDDTDRLKSENEIISSRNEAEIAAKAKSNFLATMSHEIRTPMNGVIGMTELLRDTNLDAQQLDIVDTITGSGQALVELINDILEFSKIEAGKVELNYIAFNLERTVYDSVRLLTTKAHEKNIEVIFYYHNSCPRFVTADAGRIRQILLNLIGNAIKFTNEGQIIIEIKCKHQSDNDYLFSFSVKDTGIGINPSSIEKLFESFTQADGSTSRKYGGTGLGLTICKQLVNLMNGTIDVISEQDRGSTFSFEVTLTETESPEKLNTAEIRNVRVLTIINNSINRQILSEQLTNWDMRISEFNNGEEALQSLLAAESSEDPYQLAIIDNILPDMSSEDLGQKISSNKKLNSTSLILFASTVAPGSASIFKETGYNAYIRQPILSDLLHETLIRVLGDQDNNNDNFITRHTIDEEKISNEQKQLNLSGSILLVEDVLVNQKVATGILNNFNLNIDIANNGEEAVTMHKDNNYDLILMDCQMPIMDGFEATQEIRKTDKAITIIAVTANALSTDRTKCIDAGMNDYLAKPFNRDQLYKILEKWLLNNTYEENKTTDYNNKDIKHSGNNANPVDFIKLEEMKIIMGSVFSELIPAYIEQSDEMVRLLPDNLENDLLTLERHAHSLKSSSLNVGAEQLSLLSKDLEEMSRNKVAHDLLNKKVMAISNEYKQVRNLLVNYNF